MRRIAIVLITLSFLLPACSTDAIRDFPGQVAQRFRARPTSTATAAEASPSAAAPTSAAASPSAEPSAAAAETTQAGGAPTALPPTSAPASAEPSVTPESGMGSVNLFFVALGDNGASGQKIGCGDSLIPVFRETPVSQEPLRTALELLLSEHDRFYGESGLYNALYLSDLQVESFTVESGTAIIELSGTLTLGGVCDGPRIEQQLMQTAIQPVLSIAREARITVNGTPLAELLSGQ